MPSGGHARSGPAPDPSSLRQDPASWVHLPAAGRQGEPPAWPLARPKVRELALWATEWTRPQALMWEALGQAVEVALYVQSVVVAEGPKATAADRTLAIRHMAELGLTVGGLAKNHWIIDPESGQAQKVASADDPDRTSARSRLHTIEGGVA